MVTCSYCGKDNPQTDATYCSYCGSSLRQQSSNVPPSPSYASQANYPAGGSPTLGLSERYEKALKRAEQLGTILLVLSVVAIILLLA
jgi:uncharacterized membrane protein YvbJ